MAVALVALTASGCTAHAHFPAAGMIRRAYADSTRSNWDGNGPRPLRTTVWYPVDSAPTLDTLTIGAPGAPTFLVGVVSPAAPLARAPKRHPLVLLSHGTGGSALQLAWLGIALARRGYIVAAVNHHGNTAAEPHYDARGFFLWWERARDMTVVLDRLLSDSLFGARIDTTRIGAAGFSLGGYTVVALAGGRTDLGQFDAFCASFERDFTCQSQPEPPDGEASFDSLRATDSGVEASLARAGDSYRDARIRAVAAMAPAVGKAFTPASLSEVRVPMLVFGGEADSIAPPPANASAIAHGVPGATLILLPAVGHYTFLSTCTPLGRRVIGDLCGDQGGVSRDAVHARVSKEIADFLDKQLT
ncbi:MAG: alpha/beta hydrolase family protein [Gemmatimonadales bacterium]